MTKIKWILVFFLLSISASVMSQQASLTIVNKSDRNLTTKIIKGSEKKGLLFKVVSIPAKGKETIYFAESGRYFTKCQAVLIAKDTLTDNDTIFSKGSPFEVISDKKRGYSNITITFKVKESKKPSSEGLIPITRKEYETE